MPVNTKIIMRNIQRPISLGIFALLLPFLGQGQVTVTGPTCVTPGTVYQYIIAGSWDSASTLRICVSGGKIAGTGDSCTANTTPVPFIQVTWDGAGSGSLNLVSSAGSAQLAVTIILPLSGGAIADSSRNITIGYDSTPPPVSCSPSSGGNCNPVYVYQWQLSIDNINWSDIDGATGVQLALTSGLFKTSYCRRKVTESGSGSTAYSDVACIIVTQTY